jgi:hypothetical protein
MSAGWTMIPHHGPVTAGCPAECLLTVLSLASFNPLARALDALSGPPRTVGDVIELYTRRQLRGIEGLGRRRRPEIEAALVLAGLDLAGRQPCPAEGARPGSGSGAGRPRPAAWAPDYEPGEESGDPGRVYLPAGTYTMVRKHDLLCVLAVLWNVGTGAWVPDPGLRQTARLSEALLRLSAAAAD